MIKTKKGKVELKGNTMTLCADLVCTILAVHEAVTSAGGDNNLIRDILAFSFDVAMPDETEDNNELARAILDDMNRRKKKA